jgi:hypothetical protein
MPRHGERLCCRPAEKPHNILWKASNPKIESDQKTTVLSDIDPEPISTIAQQSIPTIAVKRESIPTTAVQTQPIPTIPVKIAVKTEPESTPQIAVQTPQIAVKTEPQSTTTKLEAKHNFNAKAFWDFEKRQAYMNDGPEKLWSLETIQLEPRKGMGSKVGAKFTILGEAQVIPIASIWWELVAPSDSGAISSAPLVRPVGEQKKMQDH